MSTNYTASLVYGFELDKDKVESIWCNSEKDSGEFHMEDRFSPTTGAKIEPVKIWDRKPSTKTWYEIDGKKEKDLYIEDWEKYLSKYLDCNVETSGSFSSGDITYVFYVNDCVQYPHGDNYGHITVYNSVIDHKDILELMPKAMDLKEKLLKLGLKVNDPSIFIAMRIN
jgi:hypothetical protein